MPADGVELNDESCRGVEEKSTVSPANYGAVLNAPTRRSSRKCSSAGGSGDNSSSPSFLAAIVYVALLLDNILLTVIVPILPDYLASINNRSHNAPLPSAASDNGSSDGGIIPQTPASSSPAAHQLAYRHLNRSSSNNAQQLPQAIMTKHPIPGKSMVNFSLWQIHEADKTPMLGTSGTFPYPKSIKRDPVRDGLADENGSIGILLAMKALVQLVFNPIVGNFSSKFGYRLPIVIGTFCLLISSLVFAIGETYSMLMLARAIQGIGSACIGVCGMSLVAQHYPEEERRSKVMGIILGSIALGVLFGYPFGGILYDMIGKSAPFIILAAAIFLNLGLQLLVMDLTVQPEIIIDVDHQKPKWQPLFENKMILAIVVAIWFSTSTMAILEPTLPIWLMQYLKPTKWQLGTVFIPDSIGYFVGTNFFGSIAYKYGQVKISCISLLLVGISSILIPNATTVSQLLLPHFALGLGIGIIDAALVPLLATYVDATLTVEDSGDAENASPSEGTNGCSYGTVYAVQQTSVCLAYFLAPLIGGELAQAFGFAWLMRIVGFFNIIYGPVLVYLHQRYDPKTLREKRNEMLLINTGRGSDGGSQYKKLYNSVETG